MTPSYTSGGLINDEDSQAEWNKPWQEVTAGGFGADEQQQPISAASSAANAFGQLHSQIASIGQNASARLYGANAAQRWMGTPVAGLSFFSQPRQPIFGINRVTPGGNVIYGQRINAHTHMATPPQGLIGGRALENMMNFGVNSPFTPPQAWQSQFTPQIQIPRAAPATSAPSAYGALGVRGMEPAGTYAY